MKWTIRSPTAMGDQHRFGEYVLATPIEPTFDFEMVCNELELISTVNDPNEAYGYEWYLGNGCRHIP